jgi:DNA-binding GntR family transcriptional regulator
MRSQPNRPAYRELADQLRTAIRERTPPNGGRLPTEFELAARHGVSRQTVRRAYQDLVNEGMVQRVPGRGTFAVPPGRYVRSVGSLEDLLAQSVDTEMEVVAPLRRADEPHEGAREQLGVQEVMEVRIRRLHDQLPFSVVVISLPADIGVRLGREPMLSRVGERRQITVLELLDRVVDPPIVEARQVVTVDRAPKAIAPLIDVGPRQAILRIDRLFIDGAGRPVELAVNYFNPDRYAYRLELKRSGGPR